MNIPKKLSSHANFYRFFNVFIMLSIAYGRYWAGFLLLASTAIAHAKPRAVSAAVWGDQYRLLKDDQGMGGFAGLKTLFDQLDPDALRFGVGDFLFPNTLAKKRDGGRHRIDLLNSFNLTASALGNHDLDGGAENTRARLIESNFIWMAANALNPDGSYFTGEQQLLIVERVGIKIAVFALMSEETPGLVIRENNITFAPIISTAATMIEKAQQRGAQIIIALTHMEPYEDQLLAKEVNGINAIFGGHDHSKTAEYIGDTLLIKAGQEAEWLANVTFVEQQNGMFWPSYNFIKNQHIKEHSKVLQKAKQYQQAQDALEGSNKTIAILDKDYDTLEDNLRSRNSEFATLIAASLQERARAELGFLFGGCIRNKHIYKRGDPFTYRDALKELPFGDQLAVIEAPGEMLIEALENGVSKMPANYGSFPQLSDITYSFDEAKPVGKRIIPESVFIQGQPLDKKRKYKVATSNVIVEGRVGYDMFKRAKVIFYPSPDLLLVDIFADYLENHPAMKLRANEAHSQNSPAHKDYCAQVEICPVKFPFFVNSKDDDVSYSPSPIANCL